MAMQMDGSEPSWGARLNTRSWTRDKSYPPWANRTQQDKWNDRGLIVWDHAAQHMVRLHPAAALDLLHDLQNNSDWQQHGTTIGEPVIECTTKDGERQERRILTNPMALVPEQTHYLLSMLQTHEAALRELAEADEHRRQEALDQVYAILLKHAHEQEAKEVDLATRPFPWQKRPDAPAWICQMGANRATVQVVDSGWFWQGCLERPHRFKWPSPLYMKFTEALSWAEEELLAAQSEDEEAARIPPKPPIERLSLATLTPAHRKRLKRYWIEPRAVEPPRLTYRVVIYLEHIPRKQKTIEISFGKLLYHGAEYPTPLQLAQSLQLNAYQVDVEYLFRDLFRVTSLATYAEAATARERAHQLWDQRALASAYRSKNVTGAAYGIEEVETMYRAWIGGYGEWPETTEERDAFMARKAFDLTLIHALDVAGYRAAHPMLFEGKSDEELTTFLHEQRTELPIIPLAARAAREQWLAEHGHAPTTSSTRR